MQAGSKRGAGTTWALLATLALGACGSMRFAGGLPPGTPIDEARRAIGGPTGEHSLPGGGTRLEFAQGSFGKQTYMLDFDPGGRLVATQQVLTEANFATIQPGMTRDELLRGLGRPVAVFGVPRQGIAVWSYRYFTGDCVMFQVSLSDAGRVTQTGQGPDPACDGPNGRD